MVGNLEEDESSSLGDSEEEETDPRVQQEVGGTVNFETNMGRGSLLDPLTTDNAIWHCLPLVACYQLVQSVLKIGFALLSPCSGTISEPVGSFQSAGVLAGRVP